MNYRFSIFYDIRGGYKKVLVEWETKEFPEDKKSVR